MKTSQHKIGEMFGQWKLVRFIASGGNGEVWEVENLKKEKGAIKLLKTAKQKSYARFRDEIQIVKELDKIEGVLPILESHLPSKVSESTPWYVMHIATPLTKQLVNESTVTIINTFISLAATLINLHKRQISHRDIKPGNLFLLNGIPCFGDFGLVEYPNKQDVTLKGEPVGPKWTMAPEMRRNAETAKGISADVYSLAKTLWIFLTKQYKGFDGQYSKETNNAIINYQPTIYASPLDNLLTDCTNDDPGKRPTIVEFKRRLLNWLKANDDYQTRNVLQWKDIQQELFPLNTPSRVIWEDAESIVAVMKKLSKTNDLSHVFIPTGGGDDLRDVRLSYEDGCIELDFGYIFICKPKRLVFESFNYDEEWNYFRLECERLEPTGYYSNLGELKQEPLTELKPLLYTDHNCNEYNDFNGRKKPTGARLIIRILPECSFVIFRRTSIYNKIRSTYDARHNEMTTDQFRSYIEKGANRLSETNTTKKKKVKSFSLIRPNKFRVKRRLLVPKEIQLINKIISLAVLRDAESIEIDKKYNMENGLTIGDEKSFQYLTEPRPKAKDLEDYLKGLSKNQLVLIAAVMYGGRDSSPPWGTPLNEMIGHLKNDSDLDESISEKIPLVEYLTKGMELYS